MKICDKCNKIYVMGEMFNCQGCVDWMKNLSLQRDYFHNIKSGNFCYYISVIPQVPSLKR
jgi:hypothetical protein